MQQNEDSRSLKKWDNLNTSVVEGVILVHWLAGSPDTIAHCAMHTHRT